MYRNMKESWHSIQRNQSENSRELLRFVKAILYLRGMVCVKWKAKDCRYTEIKTANDMMPGSKHSVFYV